LADAILFFDEAPAQSTAVAGGKGASLSRLAAAGLPVPPGFVISAGVFHAFLQSCSVLGVINEITAGLDTEDSGAIDRAASTIQGRIVSAVLPAQLIDQIGAAYGRLAAGGPVAVRSSGVSEDGATASFAGQQETYLNVHGIEDVLRRVQDCWASFFSPRALFYRSRKGVLSDTRMAVVVQEMVQADKSGVMFTVDPIRGRYEYMIIEGAAGLGEAIVSGEITPDHYVVSREDGSVENQYIPGGGAAAVLTLDELHGLRALGLQLERLFGAPQDVEWCIRGNQVLLVQSRPITTLAHS
jgi:pyruvate, water dikinase